MPSDLPRDAGRTLADRLGDSGTGFDAHRGDFDILNAALAATGLDAALADPDADLTLFAPTDAAFLRLARSLGHTGPDETGAFDAIGATLAGLAPDGDPIPLLTEVLTYHVAEGALTAREIAGARQIATLSGEAIAPFGLRLGDLDPTAPDPRLIADRADLEAGNGIVQAIDRVLLPADLPEAEGSAAPRGTLADRLAASGGGLDGFGGDFDILNAALAATGLDAALADPAARLTLLAPTDDAFAGLARALGSGGTDEAETLEAVLAALADLGGGDPLPVLEDVLLHHVLDGRSSRQQLAAEGEADPLSGPALGFRGAEILDAEPDAAVRFVPGGGNVLAENGALHAVEGVLLPLNLDVI